MLTEKMMGEYIAGVDVYLAQVREASKEDVKKYQVEIINMSTFTCSLNGTLQILEKNISLRFVMFHSVNMYIS
jgi:hypothetical protein